MVSTNTAYRPVAVLRADFKIIAFVMTARISPHLRQITADERVAILQTTAKMFCKRLQKMSFSKLVIKMVKGEPKVLSERVDPSTWLTQRRNPRNAFARIDCERFVTPCDHM